MRILLVAGVLTLAAASTALAQTSLQNGSTAVTAGSQAAAALTESGVQTASAAAVLPVSVVGGASMVGGAVVGGVGSGVVAAAQDSADAAFGRAPLRVDRKVVIKAQPAPVVPYQAQAPQAQGQR